MLNCGRHLVHCLCVLSKYVALTTIYNVKKFDLPIKQVQQVKGNWQHVIVVDFLFFWGDFSFVGSVLFVVATSEAQVSGFCFILHAVCSS